MKTIVIYYGYGNHTRMIAEKVQEILGCDILKIEPKIPYSEDYETVVEETKNNLKDRKTPEIKDISINLDEYDHVILGTPVWWYTIAPPIRTFLTTYDLSNKIVYPFATNAGWLGSTFEEIKELCKGTIKDEMDIQFTTNHEDNRFVTNSGEITKWIEKIKEEI